MIRRPAAALLLLLLMQSRGQAATNCTASATAIAFGTVSFSAVASTGTVSVLCDANDGGISVALSAGGSGNYLNRKMSSGANVLQYNLYTNSAHSIVWGNGLGGTSTDSGSATKNVALNFTVYGYVPAQTLPAPGSYSDTIMVTVTY